MGIMVIKYSKHYLAILFCTQLFYLIICRMVTLLYSFH